MIMYFHGYLASVDFVFDDVLVSGEEDVELDGPHLVLDDAADRGRSLVADDIDRRGPFIKLQRPVSWIESTRAR